MTVLSIQYDLNKQGQDYESLFKAIQSLGPSLHVLKSAWLVYTSFDAAKAYEAIRHSLDQNDRILIMGVTKDYSGWLPKDSWEWIRKYVV